MKYRSYSWAMYHSHDFYHETYSVRLPPHTFTNTKNCDIHDYFCHQYDNGNVCHEQGKKEDIQKIQGEGTNR